MSEHKLAEELVARSVSDIWDEAKHEWKLHKIYWTDDPDTCLCGHSPIKEICIVENKRNGNRAQVGNCCVKNFLGMSSTKLFASLKRVMKDSEAALNADTIMLCRQRGMITEWERKFYIDTWRKHSLSDKQMLTRRKINAKILRQIVTSGAKA